jgi:hypothetical protein
MSFPPGRASGASYHTRQAASNTTWGEKPANSGLFARSALANSLPRWCTKHTPPGETVGGPETSRRHRPPALHTHGPPIHQREPPGCAARLREPGLHHLGCQTQAWVPLLRMCRGTSASAGEATPSGPLQLRLGSCRTHRSSARRMAICATFSALLRVQASTVTLPASDKSSTTTGSSLAR